MTVIRVNKTKDYTVMSNQHLKERRLSLKAIGLMSKMLALPEDWDYSVAGLTAICKESKSSIQGALKELEDAGYLVRTIIHNEKGQFDYQYDIFEEPQTVSPRTEKPFTVSPCTENRPQLNTNKLNTNKSNTKELRDKQNKLIDSLIESEEIKIKIHEYIEMRKLIKAPMTDAALKMLINKLKKLSQNKDEQLQILENSIIGNWKSVYPLKGDQKKPETRGTDRKHDFSDLERRLTRR